MSHLNFIKVESTLLEKRKTGIYQVYSTYDDSFLGEVRWYGAWRQYVLFAEDGSFWSDDCLEEVAQYIKQLMYERRELKKEEKKNGK